MLHSTNGGQTWNRENTSGIDVIYAIEFIDDQTGLRIYAQTRPEIEFNFDGQTSFSIGTEKLRERLRPQDFPGLADNRDYPQETAYVSFETQAFATLGLSGNLASGEAINLSPPAGVEPEVVDSSSAELTMFWRPIDRLRIDSTFLYTELKDPNGAGSIFTNEIFRTKFNYQFTKEWSLRFIVQQDDIQPGAPSLSSLPRERNRNYDVLVRYVINP